MERLPRAARSLPAYLLAAALAVFLFIPRAGEVRELQSKSYDFHMRAQSPRASSDVVVIEIDDHDYHTLFGGRSPLDTAVVARLVEAAARSGPRVVGVDLDVPAPRLDAPVPVVWASGRIEPGATRRGVAALLADPDWVIRRYAPVIGEPPDTAPTFATAVLRAAGAPAGQARRGLFASGSVGDLEERLIEFRDAKDARLRLTAGTLLELASEPGFTDMGPLRGKLVLIGGNYDEARDRFLTPLGLMPGVDVWAQVIETELTGGGSVPPGWLWPVLLQLGSATLIIMLFRTASLRTAMIAGAIALPALSILGGLLAFGSVWHALYFFPSLVVILVWELYDRASDYLKVLKARIASEK